MRYLFTTQNDLGDTIELDESWEDDNGRIYHIRHYKDKNEQWDK